MPVRTAVSASSGRTRAYEEVGEVQADRGGSNQNLTGTRRCIGPRPKLQLLGAPVPVDEPGARRRDIAADYRRQHLHRMLIA
jgi:hypothetical protein